LNAYYPKVLFVTPCAFNQITGGGITFRNLFRGWPVESLLTVTGDHIPFTRDVCKNFYRLTRNDLRYRHPFSFFASPIIESGLPTDSRQPASGCTQDHAEESSGGNVVGRGRQLLRRLVRPVLGNAGLPDCGTLSSGLKAHVERFRPEVLYTILGSAGYLDIVLGLQREFQLPIAMHVMDEGVVNPDWRGVFSGYKKKVFHKRLNQVLHHTARAAAIGSAMADAYTDRYGIRFDHFQNTIEIDQLHSFFEKDLQPDPVPRIVYAGSILPYAQTQSIVDSCEAVCRLNEAGFTVKFEIYTPLDLLPVDKNLFLNSEHISLLDIPAGDEAFFWTLNSADALLLPVNFDQQSTHFIRYSMPTKIPGYLLSGTPILVYGPAEVAQVAYAREAGWGLVADWQGVDLLADGIRRIFTDIDLRQNLRSQARNALACNHDAKIVRKAFQGWLAAAGRRRS